MTDSEPTPISFIRGNPADGPTAEVYRCHIRVEDLQPTDSELVKFCRNCQKSVYRVSDIHGFSQMVAAGRCIWVAAEDRIEDSGELAGTPYFDPPEPGRIDPILLRPLTEWRDEISATVVDRLAGAGITLVGDLISAPEASIRRLKFSRQKLAGLQEHLASCGLTLGMRFVAWPPAPDASSDESSAAK